jgi:hypothetical protein
VWNLLFLSFIFQEVLDERGDDQNDDYPDGNAH